MYLQLFKTNFHVSVCPVFIGQILVIQDIYNVSFELYSSQVTGSQIDETQGLFIIKATRRTNFTNLFWCETLQVSDSSSVHHQVFIHCTLSNGICHTGLQTAFEQKQDGTVKLVHLVGFIIKKFFTMHGHMNVKRDLRCYFCSWKILNSLTHLHS